MDKAYFNTIDTEQKAYILGFLYADGYFSSKSGRISLRLSAKDVVLLKEISNILLQKDKVVLTKKEDYKYEAVIRGRKINIGDMIDLSISCKEMAIDLKNTGNESPKSLTLTYPTNLPKELNRHFIRGYFDGDGCVCIKNNSLNNVKRCEVCILSSLDFCNTVKHIIEYELNINAKVKIQKDVKIHKTIITGNRQCEIFLDWIYADSTIRLERKYEKYIRLKEHVEKCKEYYSKSYSKYNNISYDKNRNKWVAFVRLPPNKTKSVGRYDTEEAAYLAQQNYLKMLIETTTI